jgi:RimJ/RimL family protein N-acetyltransferase
MKIVNCEIKDEEEVFRLYSFASAYQKLKNVVVWPQFEQSLVLNEIKEHRMYKLLMNEQMACVWSIAFSDKEIWEERDTGDAIYIHRIAINPAYRGNNFVKEIVAWSKEYALNNGKKIIRLDTLGYNTKLIEHYANAGFNFLGMFTLKNTAALPAHYRENPDCCLFEMSI